MPHDKNNRPVQVGDSVTLTATVLSVCESEDFCNVTLSVDNATEEYKPCVTMNTKGVTIVTPCCGEGAGAAAPKADDVLQVKAIHASGNVYAGQGGVWVVGPDGHSVDVVSIAGQTYVGLRKKGNLGPNDFAVSIGDDGVFFQIALENKLYQYSAHDFVIVFESVLNTMIPGRMEKIIERGKAAAATEQGKVIAATEPVSIGTSFTEDLFDEASGFTECDFDDGERSILPYASESDGVAAATTEEPGNSAA